MTIHMFGAYFGLAASYAFGPQSLSSSDNADPNRVSDILALLGTGLLWIYWPSFVGATETSNPATEQLCVMHTILALLGSTGATFYFGPLLSHGKFDPVHVANATLAGGVAVGSAARLPMTPAGAILLGALAGTVSVYGYVYSSPALESALSLYDTCGVGNLHGYPSVLGALVSIGLVGLHSDEPFLSSSGSSQSSSMMMAQLLAILGTLTVSIVGGLVSGFIIMMMDPYKMKEEEEEYEDGVWWEGPYFAEI